MRPHGLRCCVTTCVGGRVRPLPPPGRAAVFVPGRAAPVPDDLLAPEPDGLPEPPRGARLSSGLRSLAKATPRYGARGGRRAGRARPPPRGSLGRRAVRAAEARAGPGTGATGGARPLSTLYR